MFVLDRHVSTQHVDYQTFSHIMRRVSPGGDVTDEALSPKIKSIRLTEV